MIDITTWTETFLNTLNETFGERVWFVGLQGSYGRGEATDNSDLDMVVILDELNPEDIEDYNTILDNLPNRDIICGFLSGKDEIMNWEPADLFQFYYDTKALKGNLDELLPLLDMECINRAIKIGACNIYHGCVHNMVFDKNDEVLRGLYKAASFVVQAICYLQTGTYYANQKDLYNALSPRECAIVDTFLNLRNGGEVQFRKMSETLFFWAKYWVDYI